MRCASRSVIPNVVFRGRQDIGVDSHVMVASLFAADAWLGTRKVLGKAVDSFILVPALVAC